MAPFRSQINFIMGFTFLFVSVHVGAKENQTNLQNGKTLYTKGNSTGAAPCISCHGGNGEGLAAASYPQLAHMSPGYLAKQLKDFKSTSRANAVMQPIATALNDQEIKDVIGYIGTLNLPTSLDQKKRMARDILERKSLGWDCGVGEFQLALHVTGLKVKVFRMHFLA